MSAASAIPAMRAALVAACTAAQATTLAGVEVIAGPPTLIAAGVGEAIAIGADWDPEEATAATSVFEPYSDYTQVETLEVPGAIRVKSGDPAALVDCTDRAFEILAALKALLVADPTLGGAVGYAADASGGGRAEETSLAQLTSATLREDIAGGARSVIAFTVGAAALIPD
jgi:hypothetical protein